MAADDHDLTPDSVTLRLRTTADLAPARQRIRRLLADAAIPADGAETNVLAISELLTNALEAIEPGGSVTAVAAVSGAGDSGRARRIDVDIMNTGEPIPGRLEVDGSADVRHRRARGRGLAIAGQAGTVVVEGLVGGTRAHLRSEIAAGSPGDLIA